MQQISSDTREAYIEAAMRRFKLVDMREQYPDLIAEAEAASMGYTDFLVRLLSVEEGKHIRRQEKLLHNARFESPATLLDIDYGFNDTLDRERESLFFPDHPPTIRKKLLHHYDQPAARQMERTDHRTAGRNRNS